MHGLESGSVRLIPRRYVWGRRLSPAHSAEGMAGPGLPRGLVLGRAGIGRSGLPPELLGAERLTSSSIGWAGGLRMSQRPAEPGCLA